MSKTAHPVWFIWLAGAFLASLLALAAPHQSRANSPAQVDDGSKCVTCHEDLYYLHDTGKAFCLHGVPMSCVDCHGGDPTAVTKEAAHFDRSAHPIINEDDKKCYECHPAEAAERVQTFETLAGVSEVRVAQPCDVEVQAQISSEAPAKPRFYLDLGIPETLLLVFGASVMLVALASILFKPKP